MTQGTIRIERRTKSGWSLIHHVRSKIAAENYIAHHEKQDLRAFDESCGCMLYSPEGGWELCATHAADTWKHLNG